MNLELIKEDNAAKVIEADFSFNPTKAHGADGMSSLFLQKF